MAPPRVVIPSKPTVAKPVPNTVTKSAADTSSEVAAVSEQPGKVEATQQADVEADCGDERGRWASEAHYVPRSRRRSAEFSGDAAVAKMAAVGMRRP